MRAWHFTAMKGGNPVLRHGSPVVLGQTLEHKGPLVMCYQGYHASLRLIDALKYAPGAHLTRVKCAGETLTSTDKLVCRRRTVIAGRDVTAGLLQAAACFTKRATKRDPKCNLDIFEPFQLVNPAYRASHASALAAGAVYHAIYPTRRHDDSYLFATDVRAIDAHNAELAAQEEILLSLFKDLEV